MRLLILVIILALTSCSVNNSHERVEKYPNDVEENTDRFVDSFLTEIWNKPVSNLVGPGGFQYKRQGRNHIYKFKNNVSERVTIYSDEVPDSKRYFECNSPSDPPPLSMYTKFQHEFDKKTGKFLHTNINSNLVYAAKIDELYRNGELPKLKAGMKIYTPKNEHRAKGYLSVCQEESGLPYYHLKYFKSDKSIAYPYTLGAWDIQKKLLAKGVPLSYCFKPKELNYSHKKPTPPMSGTVNCAFDIGKPAGCSGDWCMYGTISLTFSTRNGRLYSFSLNDLKIKKEEWDLTLAEIYSTRFQDPKYVESVALHFTRYKGFSDWKTYTKQAKIDETESQEQAYRRNRARQRAEALSAGIQSGISKIKNSSIGLQHGTYVPPKKHTPKSNEKIYKAGQTSGSQAGSAITPTSGGSGQVSPKDTNKTNLKPQKKLPSRTKPIFIQEEGLHGWDTQDEACTYAKQYVIRLAEKRCKSEFKGVKATTSDVPEPVNVNCQSYRQMEKDGFTHSKGQWKVTGNVIMQCRLPNG